MKTALARLLHDNTANDLTGPMAKEVLDSYFEGKYQIKTHLGTGTIASCYLVTDDSGNQAVAKIMSPNTEYQIAVGVRALEFFTAVLPESLKSLLQPILETFKDECSLSSEHQKLNAYKKAVLAKDTDVTFKYKDHDDIDHKVNLLFKVPTTIEAVDQSQDNLLVMEKAGGSTLAKLGNNKQLLAKEFEKCFSKQANDEDLESFMKEIKAQIDNKWNQVLGSHKMIHGDLHSGNIIIEFMPSGQISCTLIDLGNSFILEDDELQALKDFFTAEKEFIDNKEDSSLNNLATIAENEQDASTGSDINGKDEDDTIMNRTDHEKEIMQKLFDAVMEPSSHKTFTNDQKESFFDLIDNSIKLNNILPQDSILTILITLCVLSGESGLKPFLYKLASAIARGRIALNNNIILRGELPKDSPTSEATDS